MKIVVTGGHLTPALAVISQLKKLNSGCKVYFFGRKYAIEGDRAQSFEYQEIVKANIPFFEITTGRLQRRLTRYSLISLFKFLPGFVKSLLLLKKIQPNLVVTFGGYLALPVAIAARFLKIPVVAHEQSPKLGLANKIIFNFARIAGVSHQSLGKKLKDSKMIFTGPLFREEIFKKRPKSKNLGQFLKNVANSKLIYVTGGATGSHFLNQIIGRIVPEILKNNFLIHQTGNLFKKADFKKLTKLRKSLAKNLSKKYFLTKFVSSEDLGAVLLRTNLVITRAGANTTFELQALGKIAIIIPLEWGREQAEIAKNLIQTGAFLVLPQQKVTAKKILGLTGTIFENYYQFEKQAKFAQSQINLTGAAIFAKKILELGGINA